jgi:hypothetical protein
MTTTAVTTTFALIHERIKDAQIRLESNLQYFPDDPGLKNAINWIKDLGSFTKNHQNQNLRDDLILVLNEVGESHDRG